MCFSFETGPCTNRHPLLSDSLAHILKAQSNCQPASALMEYYASISFRSLDPGRGYTIDGVDTAKGSDVSDR